MYCSFILGGINESLKNKLQYHQYAALRAVRNVHMSYSTSHMFAELNVDSIRTEMKKSSCKMVFKGFYDSGPMALNDLFVLHVPEKALRSGDELMILAPRCNTAFGQRNLIYRGCLYWNSLPSALKMKEKTHLKPTQGLTKIY